MPSLLLLVIGDPEARFLSPLSRLSPDVSVTISQDPDELAAKARDADAILYAHTSLNASLLTPILPIAGKVRWIHSLWTGVEGILTPDVVQHPSTLTNGRGAFSSPLADWVTAVMLMFSFDLRRVIQQQEEAVWKPFTGATLAGRTLGIVGYGSIGRAAAARARSFGMKIGAIRRRTELFEGDAIVDRSFDAGQLRDLLAISDFVLVSAPLTAQTRGMIGVAQITAMKDSAVIINVGRGPVIEEKALVRALESGRIRGAALDVFDTEPLPAGHPFSRMRNVLLSPHTADRVEGFLDPAFEGFFENLGRFRDGRPLLNVVDKHAGY
jgi:phosphoglycerate dehydrogenase-like enzyme